MKCIYGIVIMVIFASAACSTATPARAGVPAGATEPEHVVGVGREKRQMTKAARNAEAQQAEVKIFGAANAIAAEGQSAIGGLQFGGRYPNYAGLRFGEYGGFPAGFAPGLAAGGGINYGAGIGPHSGLDMFPGLMYSGAGIYPGATQIPNNGNLDNLVNLANYPGLNPGGLGGGQPNPQFQLQAQQSQLQQQILQPYGQLSGAYYPQMGYNNAFQGYPGYQG